METKKRDWKMVKLEEALNRRNETEYAAPSEAIAAILEKEKQIVYLLDEIKHLVRQ